MKTRIEFIDFAKGFAMLSIVLFHYFQHFFVGLLDKAITFGGSGVHLFIFISGFGLGLSSQSLSNIPFYKRRFTKIIIPYYSYITFIFILNNYISIYPKDGLYAFLGHIFLFKMFDESIIGSYGTHLWFLSTIFQLYLVFPLLIKFKNKIGDIPFIKLSFAVSLIYWVIINILNLDKLLVFSNSGLQFLWEFCIGIVLSDFYLKKEFKFWEINRTYLLIFMVLGIILTGYLAVYGKRTGKTFNDIPAFFGYTSMVILFFRISNKLALIRNIISKIGRISFELYLSHMVIFYFLNIIFSHYFSTQVSSILGRLFLFLPISIFFAYLFNLLNKKIIVKLQPYLKQSVNFG